MTETAPAPANEITISFEQAVHLHLLLVLADELTDSRAYSLASYVGDGAVFNAFLATLGAYMKENEPLVSLDDEAVQPVVLAIRERSKALWDEAVAAVQEDRGEEDGAAQD